MESKENGLLDFWAVLKKDYDNSNSVLDRKMLKEEMDKTEHEINLLKLRTKEQGK